MQPCTWSGISIPACLHVQAAARLALLRCQASLAGAKAGCLETAGAAGSAEKALGTVGAEHSRCGRKPVYGWGLLVGLHLYHVCHKLGVALHCIFSLPPKRLQPTSSCQAHTISHKRTTCIAQSIWVHVAGRRELQRLDMHCRVQCNVLQCAAANPLHT